ncbi:MAG TPA: GNAT family N-acetyltransferase, partial [Candidatus Kryptonia bacterium]|nr:GNAT family N-acetyltransferase [Candidatus Kryptonia bacterium]
MGTTSATDFRRYAAQALLRDGTSIHIRALRPDDKLLLVEHFQRLSAQSVYFRFFSAKKRMSDDELARFTELDFVSHAALVATLRDGEREYIVGVARYAPVSTDHGSERRAEIAFAVLDQYQGRGVGTLLLEHLAPIAHANGIT